MRKKLWVLVILVIFLALIPLGIAQAKKPLMAMTEHDFVGSGGIAWQGTISGDIEGQITWFAPAEMWLTGQASHYDESWEIVDAQGNVLMRGTGYGSTTIRHGKNSIWRTNGIVTEAYGEYENWAGRHVHESGSFEWAAPGVPSHGISTFQVN